MTELSQPDASEPVEELLADRIDALHTARRPAGLAVTQLRALGRIDRAAYRLVAGSSTPWLDGPLRAVSGLANLSGLWFATAGVLALFGGSRGRWAAATGVSAIALTSLTVNQPMKRASDRRRPDRERLGVPNARRVPMPSSSSFPSGHSASAVAFAVSVGDNLPGLRVPLRLAASVVAFSRIYTGVHYPGDVIVGVAAGAVIGRATSTFVTRISTAP